MNRVRAIGPEEWRLVDVGLTFTEATINAAVMPEYLLPVGVMPAMCTLCRLLPICVPPPNEKATTGRLKRAMEQLLVLTAEARPMKLSLLLEPYFHALLWDLPKWIPSRARGLLGAVSHFEK